MRDSLSAVPVGDDAAWVGLSAAVYVPTAIGSAGWIAWRSGGPELWARLIGTQPGLWLIAGLFLGAAAAATIQLISPRVTWVQAMSDELAVQMGPLSAPATAAVAALSSVGEELLFRGVLQPAWGLVPATLVFALAHMPIQRELRAWPVTAGAMGLVLAGLFHTSQGLVAPIALHFTVNALNLRWLSHRAAEIKSAPR